MGYIPDPHEKTVKLPVRIAQGRVEFLYGGLLPAISDGTIGDLVVPYFSIVEERAKEMLSEEEIHEFLPEGSKILIALKRSKIPERLLDKTTRPSDKELQDCPWPNHRFVAIYLKEDLALQIRSTKHATMLNCNCYVPALNFRARSLNHAYTVISTFFEPDRRSHSGNVFRLGLYFDERLKSWRQLDELRKYHEAEFERNVAVNLISE